MSTVVLSSPATLADDATIGTVAWSSPGNAVASDDAYVTAAVNNQTTHYLKATGFGAAIPTGATINGITVEVESKVSGSSRFGSYHICKAGAYAGAARNVLWTTTEQYYSVGGAADLWGQAWTPADINDAGFGVGVYSGDPGVNTFSVDHIRITIDYTPLVITPPEVSRQDGLRFSPGCCCSPVVSGCFIGGDDFDRADNDDIGTSWSERVPSSAWAISSNTLIATIPYDLAIYQIAHPKNVPSMIAWAEVMGSIDGDTLRVIICWVDDDNYLWSELETDTECGWLRLWQRSAGHNTLLKEMPITGGIIGQWHTLYACYDSDPEPYEGSGRFEGRVETASLEWFTVAENVSAAGTYAGLGTGPLTGTATFDNFELWMEQTDDDPECPTCKRGVESCEISADNFNRATSSDLGCLWDQKVASSSWNIQDETLWTLTPYDLVEHLVGHPDGEANLWARVLVQGSDPGDILRLMIAYEDTANYLWVELEISDTCGTLRLFQREAGVVTQLGLSVPVDDAFPEVWHTLEACYQEPTASADGRLFGKVITDSGVTVRHSAEAIATGTKAGLGTGNLYSHVMFDDFELEKLFTANDVICRVCEDPDECLIYLDNFNGTPGYDLGCAWTVLSGVPSITLASFGGASGSLQFDAEGLVLCDIPHPDEIVPSQQWVMASLWARLRKIAGTTAVARVYVGWLSSSEHHYVELSIEYVPSDVNPAFDSGVAWLRCYKVTGGVASQISSTSYLPFYWDQYNNYVGSITVCYLGDEIRARSTGPGGIDIETWTTTDSGGRLTGLGAGTGEYEFLRYDWFRFERHQTSDWEECHSCEEEISCTDCSEGRGPQRVRITLTGVVNADPTICSNCNFLNGSEVVDRREWDSPMVWYEGFGDDLADPGPGSPRCYWTRICWKCSEQTENEFYPQTAVGVYIVQLATGDWEVRGTVQYVCHHAANSGLQYFALNVGSSRPDCDNWYRLEIPWSLCPTLWFIECGSCDFTNAKLLVTAI